MLELGAPIAIIDTGDTAWTVLYANPAWLAAAGPAPPCLSLGCEGLDVRGCWQLPAPAASPDAAYAHQDLPGRTGQT